MSDHDEVVPDDPSSIPDVDFDEVASEVASTFSDAAAPAGEAPEAGIAGAGAAAEEVAAAADPLAAVTAERDEYLDALQRLKAEFANHRRRTTEQAGAQREQAAAGIVEKLLPVLDSCEAALAHDAEAIRPVLDSLLDVLTNQGLTRLDQAEVGFDPEYHEAVMHEAGDGSDAAAVVAEVMRTGYLWNGRVLRPAMVRVRG